MRAAVEGVGGHAWTVWSHLRDRWRPAAAPPAVSWSATVVDPQVGQVRLTGLLDHVPGAERIAIIVHGMGGSADRPYCAATARAARAAGMSSLRLNLRGADGSGEDFYHIGMVDDLAAALAHPEVARYPVRVVLGYSLGGHVALRHAAITGQGGGLRAVAAVCAPIDLEAGARHIDHPARWIYRKHLLDGVKEMIRKVAARRPLRTPMSEIEAIRTIRAWDELVVAPRFGFAGALDYYQQVGVGPLLSRMEVPTLFVGGTADPMIPARCVRPALERASSAVEVRWIRQGGHLGFPRDAEVMQALVDWLRRA